MGHLSLPPQGAWIEIISVMFVPKSLPSLPTQGAWIEIHVQAKVNTHDKSRSLLRERGLKFICIIINYGLKMSLPTQGAWIEIDRDRR